MKQEEGEELQWDKVAMCPEGAAKGLLQLVHFLRAWEREERGRRVAGEASPAGGCDALGVVRRGCVALQKFGKALLRGPKAEG